MPVDEQSVSLRLQTAAPDVVPVVPTNRVPEASTMSCDTDPVAHAPIDERFVHEGPLVGLDEP
jgi:hypothetical protein